MGQALESRAVGFDRNCGRYLEPSVRGSAWHEAVLTLETNINIFCAILKYGCAMQSTAAQNGDRTMPTPISRDEVLRLMRDEGAQLVEVLPPQEYEDEHIAGAVNIPLKRLSSEGVSGLEKGQPVIVY